MTKKGIYFILLSIIFLSGILSFFSLSNGHGWGDDFALYIRQAQSLLNGNISSCLKENSFAMQNSTAPLGPDLYPWGFPILLSPVILCFGFNLFAMKLIVAACYLCSLWIIYFLFKDKSGQLTALLLVGVFAVNYYLILYTDYIMSDIPYFFFALACLLLIQRTLYEKKIPVNRFINYCIIGFLIFYAYYIRSNGIILLFTLFICQLIKNRHLIRQGMWSAIISKRRLPAIMPYIVFLVLMLISNLILPAGSNSYVTRLISSDLNFKDIFDNIVFYITKAPVDFYAPYIRSVYLFTLPFVIAGLVKNFKKDYLYIIYCALSLLLFIVWPSRQGMRFIISLLPFYIYFLLIGLKLTTTLLLPSKSGIFNLQNLFCSLLIILFLMKLISYDRANMKNNRAIGGAFAKTSKDMYSFVISNSTKEDMFIFYKARIFALMTNRIAFMISDSKQILNSKANYVVLDKKAGKYDQVPYNDPIYHEKQECFTQVFQNEEFLILKINHLAGTN